MELSTPHGQPPSQKHLQTHRRFTSQQQQRQQGPSNDTPTPTPTPTPLCGTNITEGEIFLAATRPRLMVSALTAGPPRPSSPSQAAERHGAQALSSHDNNATTSFLHTAAGNIRDPSSSPAATADAAGAGGGGGEGGARGTMNHYLGCGDKSAYDKHVNNDDDTCSNEIEDSTTSGKRKELYVRRSRPHMPPQDDKESFSIVIATGGKGGEMPAAGSSLSAGGVRNTKARKLAGGDTVSGVIPGTPSRDMVGGEVRERWLPPDEGFDDRQIISVLELNTLCWCSM